MKTKTRKQSCFRSLLGRGPIRSARGHALLMRTNEREIGFAACIPIAPDPPSGGPYGGVYGGRAARDLWDGSKAQLLAAGIAMWRALDLRDDWRGLGTWTWFEDSRSGVKSWLESEIWTRRRPHGHSRLPRWKIPRVPRQTKA
jgi:hypothetical protein